MLFRTLFVRAVICMPILRAASNILLVCRFDDISPRISSPEGQPLLTNISLMLT